MKQALLTSTLAFGLIAVFSAAFGAAAPAGPEVALYDGKTLAQDSLSISSWGGGSVEDSTALFLFGGHSLKVTTLDFYQGAKINLLTPVALTGANRMFQLTLQRGAVTLHYDPQTVPGAVPTDPQAAPGGGRRRRGGFGGNPGGFGGGPGGFGGGPGGFGGGPGGFGGRSGRFGRRGSGGQTPLIPLITKLRLEFTLADGRKADIVEPIPTIADTVAGDGWYSVDVPLSSLKFGSGAETKLQSVTVAGDQYGVFYVGRMQIAPLAAPPVETAKPAPAIDPEPGLPEDSAAPSMDGQPVPPEGGPNIQPSPPPVGLNAP